MIFRACSTLKHLVALVFFIIMRPGSVAAVDEQYNFINIGSKEGLSSNIVNDILKDRYGYLWFSTDDGLNKFDGTHFTVYRKDPDRPGSIVSNDITDLYEDRKGNLWIGTGVGLVCYNRKKDSFTDYSDITDFFVTSVCSDQSGNIWVAGYDGITILDPIKRRVLCSTALSTLKKGQRSKISGVLKLFNDSRGRIWIGTNNGIYLYQDKRALRYYSHDPQKQSSLTDNRVRAICEDSQGNIWFGTDNGLSMFNAPAEGFMNYRNTSNPESLNSDIIYTIAADTDGKLWVGTEEGLTILDCQTGKAKRIDHSFKNQSGFVGKSVKSILIDDQGIYWLATFRAGVNKYDKNLPFFNFRQVNVNTSKGLHTSVVTSFAKAGAEAIYFGTDGGGLQLFDFGSGLVSRVPGPPYLRDGDLAVLCMEIVGRELWMGTYLQGIQIMDLYTKKWRQLRKSEKGGGISDNNVFSLKKDSEGNVWIGTNGQGLDKFDAKNGRFYHYAITESDRYKLGLNGYIRTIEEDLQGNIWIGSNGSGLAVYKPGAETKIYDRLNSTLPTNYINSLYLARDGKMWIGLRGALAYWDSQKNDFVCFSEKSGIANAVIYKIMEDNTGKIWVSTNKGLSCFNPRRRTFTNFSHHNGLQRNPFVMGAGLKLASGRMFFGGTDGINYFEPKDMPHRITAPRVVLTDFKVSNRSVIPSDNAELSEHISVARNIRIDYKQNISLSFSALNYTSPYENQYAYKLDNFDREWNYVGKNTTAYYTNLSPGYYTFRVRAISESGSWRSKESTIRIYVSPPLWLRWYAFLFYALLVAGVLWYSRYKTISRLKVRFREKEEQLAALRLLEEEKREAERQREFDQLRVKFLTNVSHEFRTPVSLIVGPLDQLLSQETNPAKIRRLDTIRRNARRLLHLVNELLDFRSLEEKESRLLATEGDLILFLKEVTESFRDLSLRKQINFQFRSALRSYFTEFDKEKIERIMFNLLSNAFKFTQRGGDVSVSILHIPGTDEGVLIRLSDSGIGIEQRKKEQIFEPFFQAEQNPEILNQGSGVGLSIVREFVKMHNGSIEVESIEGKGTVFTLHLRLQQIGAGQLPEEEPKEPEYEKKEDQIQGEAVIASLPEILLVEDNEDFRFYLKDSLKDHYKVVEASNGKEGWQKVLSAHPKIVISDISMPYLSGVDLCKKIKADKRTSHIPVVLLTAITGEDEQLTALSGGADDYVTKPCNFDILNIKIRNLLNLNDRLKNTYSKQLKVTPPDIQIESDKEKFLNKVLKYIESNLTNPQLSVEDLSRNIGMSRGSLYTKILELTGETPVEFIRSVKLDRAAVLLEKSDMNVAQVSYSVGFSTPNYFSRAFRNRFNMLPSEYLNQRKKVG